MSLRSEGTHFDHGVSVHDPVDPTSALVKKLHPHVVDEGFAVQSNVQALFFIAERRVPSELKTIRNSKCAVDNKDESIFR